MSQKKPQPKLGSNLLGGEPRLDPDVVSGVSCRCDSTKYGHNITLKHIIANPHLTYALIAGIRLLKGIE